MRLVGVMRTLGVLCLLCMAVNNMACAAPRTVGFGTMAASCWVESIRENDGMAGAENPACMKNGGGVGLVFEAALPYNLTDLKTVEGMCEIAAKICSFRIQGFRGGNSVSAYTRFGGGLARKFGKFGCGFEYMVLVHTLESQRYRTSYSRVGISFEPVKEWLLALHVENVERRFLDYEYSSFRVPVVIALATRWRATDIFSLLCELEKESGTPLVGKIEAYVKPTDRLFGSVSFSSAGTQIGAKAGYKGKVFGISGGVAYHNTLGIGSRAEIVFTI